MNRHTNTRGFTLIEVLLVIAILAILATIVIIAINPSKQLGESQDAQRHNDVRSILDAVYQFALDNNGVFPGNITIGNDDQTCLEHGHAICKEGVSCSSVSLDGLVSNDAYLVDLPADPTAADAETTGYYIFRSTSNRVSVCAPSAYGDDITVTR